MGDKICLVYLKLKKEGMKIRKSKSKEYAHLDNEEFSLMEGDVVNKMRGCAFLFLGVILAIVTCIVTFILWK